ncbi:ankyrin-3-like [Zophobas morio]|uniref:ankyrin-3-like n=1 Tax=Zophobas morio TaxID=2755281 RepID=UPI003083D490
MLLECSASINIVDKDNNSLHYASQSRQGNPNITKLLIEKGIDVNLQNNNGMTALQVSCQSGNYENSLMLLECDALMNIRDNEDNNALHHASKLWEDNRDLLKLLIKKGIHIDAQNKYGETVLQLACLKGDQEIVEMALEHNASVNISNEGLSNALHYASRSWWNNRDIIKLLIKKGIEVNAQNENGTTSLQLACGNGDLEITKMLLEFGACINIVDKQNHTALNYASKLSTDNRSIIKLLIKKGINVSAESKNGTTALQFTCLNGVYENTKMLLDFGASVNIVDKSNNNNLLHFATASRRTTRGIIRLLIKKGIDINAKNKNGMTALQLACERGVYANAKLLLDCGASINILDKGNNNALHFASSSKYDTTDIVNLLITRGIDVNIQNKSGATALHLVCEKGSHESAHILLKYGSSINVVDKDNCSALHYASRSWTDNRNIIKLLIEKGIDVNIQDENGTTAIQFACKNCDYQITKMLLKCGSSVNDVDKENSNALHYAAKAECENEDIIELLIEKGINVNSQNKNGTTALHLASENADFDIAQTLLESGASVNILDKDNNNALHYYVRSKKRRIRNLWKKSAQHCEGALLLAREQGMSESSLSLLFLKDHFINVSKKKQKISLENGTVDIITLLVENGIDVNAKNKNGTTPLQLACKHTVYEKVEMLLTCGALTNLMDEENNNALHYASNSEYENQHIINLLIQKGVDVNAQNKYGTTALQLACKNGVYGNTEILLEYDASIKITDENNQSALHYALESEADNQCVIKLLIEKGIDINTRSENGTTALQLACKKGVYDLVDMLLEFGASVNTLDKCNNNALHYGLWARGDNRRILKLLIEKGVDIRVQNKIKVAAFQLL